MRLLCLPLLAACQAVQVATIDTADTAEEVVEDCESTDSSTWYVDGDGDGYGDEPITALCQPEGTVTVDGDCDDANEHTWPGAEDICDGQDNDCNGVADDGEAGTLQTWYGDADGDGYGHPAATTEGCSAPNGYVDNNEDCDDNNGGVYPGAPEICDDAENDCLIDYDNWTDDGMATFYSFDTETHTNISDQLSLDEESPAVLTLTQSGILTLCDGTWHTRIILDADDIEVRGLNGPEGAILDGGAAGPVITVSAGYSATIEDLAVTNGAAEQGGGVYVAPVECPEEKKDDKKKDEDGEVEPAAKKKPKVTQPDVTLDNLNITGNTAEQGGGVYASQCVDLEIDDSLIEGNTASTGGGVYVGDDPEDDVDFFLDDSTVTGNTALTGGGVWVVAGWASVADTVISENTAQTGGGIAGTGTLYLYTNHKQYSGVLGNIADEGGGIYLTEGTTLYSSEIDWGGEEDEKTGETTEDNSPDDIAGAALTDGPYRFGLSASFTCTDKEGCVEDEDDKKKKEDK